MPGWTALALSPDGWSSTPARPLTPASRGEGRNAMPSEGPSDYSPADVSGPGRGEGSSLQLDKKGLDSGEAEICQGERKL